MTKLLKQHKQSDSGFIYGVLNNMFEKI